MPELIGRCSLEYSNALPNMPADTITLHAGIISVNGQPFLSFHSSRAAAIFLGLLGYRVRVTERDTYSFSK